MARANTATLLSLDRWAELMGVNPVHFNGGEGNAINIFPLRANCNDFWPQYAWQYNDRLSRDELADAINTAEYDIARAIGYYPAPKWIAQETHRFPRHYRREVWQTGGLNVRGARKSVQCKFGKFIQGGQRAVSAVQAGAAVVRSDPDGDGYSELATITAATTLTNECEIKLYFSGHAGVPEWEIRPVRSKTIAGGNVVITVSSWLLFDPDLWEAYPSTFGAIDITDNANYVTTVDVYREYNDFSQAGAVFYWEPDAINWGGFCSACSGTGCAACSLTTQNGCLHQRGDPDDGVVVPSPASYDDDNAQWAQATFSVCRDPDSVKLYYYAGLLSDRWLNDETCEVLSDWWAMTIAMVAMARLSKPPCSCNHVRERYDELRQDMTFIGREGSHILAPELLSNPLGTRRGEIAAWRRMSGLVERRLSGGAI